MPDPTLTNLQKEIIDLKIRVNNLEKAESFFEKISVVNDALTASKPEAFQQCTTQPKEE